MTCYRGALEPLLPPTFALMKTPKIKPIIHFFCSFKNSMYKLNSSINSIIAVTLLCTLLSADDSPKLANQSRLLRPPEKLVVLTFDDSVVNHATIVAPLLKKFGFSATFFITEGFEFLTNKTNYMTWDQIKGLHAAGFEIGNHTRYHQGVNGQTTEQIEAGIIYIEEQCAKHQIPRPTSFCYPGYATSPLAVEVLRNRGYKFARAGGSTAFDPVKDDPLRMPQVFDSKPGVTFEQFTSAVAEAKDGKIAVLTFHGVPDRQHPWVNTEPAQFEKYLTYLKEQDCTVIAARDIAKYLPKSK